MRKPGISILWIFLFVNIIYSQDVTLDYIFQDTAIINARPSLKQISSTANKIYYYADDDYNGTLDMFTYNYFTGETFKFTDLKNSASEFRLLPNGDALSVIDGDLYISANFVYTNKFTKDRRITKSDDYEYSPAVAGNFIIYRKSGNYFITRFDTLYKDLQLTEDESDSISYQILGISNPYNNGKQLRILFARYDNLTEETYLFPNYMNEFVTVEKEKRGVSLVKLIEYEIFPNEKNHSLAFRTNDIKYPFTERLSTQYAVYSPDAKTIVLDAETLNRKTRKLYNFDTEKKYVTEIYSESDDAWFERHRNATRFIDSNRILFESEVSGYNNLYFINDDGSGFTKTAGGNYTILESAIDTEKKKIYYIANKETPVEYSIYEKEFEGTGDKKLTTLVGDYEDLRISHDGNYLFYKYSNVTSPSELYFYNIYAGAEIRITNTINQKFSSIDWTVPELIKYNNEEDGQLIYAYLYKPKKFSAGKKYPLICFAHGSGYLQEVTKGFSPYSDNFMVNTYLVSEGYVVLDVDFRGSAGYGKNFRTKTYRNLGYWEVSDYISGIDYLDKQGMIDRNRVGIYGGSYGGFVTLMAAFRHPEYFKAAVALRAVSNWKNYFYSNWWYTLARLGDYNNDTVKEFYKISSPITYADNLQIPLLLIHGMLDENVFFQDDVQLIQKLIELKKDFEVMVYPREHHSFYIQSDWLDQYKRINKFFEKHLR
jgi:dipeptidyl aminopeptidase/acylaminoacyl peptidase